MGQEAEGMIAGGCSLEVLISCEVPVSRAVARINMHGLAESNLRVPGKARLLSEMR